MIGKLQTSVFFHSF